MSKLYTGWLTDRERLARTIYYSTAEPDAVTWPLAEAAVREMHLDMADKIHRAIGIESEETD